MARERAFDRRAHSARRPGPLVEVAADEDVPRVGPRIFHRHRAHALRRRRASRFSSVSCGFIGNVEAAHCRTPPTRQASHSPRAAATAAATQGLVLIGRLRLFAGPVPPGLARRLLDLLPDDRPVQPGRRRLPRPSTCRTTTRSAASRAGRSTASGSSLRTSRGWVPRRSGSPPSEEPPDRRRDVPRLRHPGLPPARTPVRVLPGHPQVHRARVSADVRERDAGVRPEHRQEELSSPSGRCSTARRRSPSSSAATRGRPATWSGSTPPSTFPPSSSSRRSPGACAPPHPGVIDVYRRRREVEREVLSSHGEAGRYFVTFLDNHDMKERIRFPRERTGLYRVRPPGPASPIAVLFGLQGIPALYYGTEQALRGPTAGERPVRRGASGADLGDRRRRRADELEASVAVQCSASGGAGRSRFEAEATETDWGRRLGNGPLDHDLGCRREARLVCSGAASFQELPPSALGLRPRLACFLPLRPSSSASSSSTSSM